MQLQRQQMVAVPSDKLKSENIGKADDQIHIRNAQIYSIFSQQGIIISQISANLCSL
jgi:hypothetical protein